MKVNQWFHLGLMGLWFSGVDGFGHAFGPNSRSPQHLPPCRTGQTLEAVTYANGMFVAVGDPGLVARSTDGANWSLRRIGGTVVLRGVAGGQDLFVAVGSGGAIFTSPDALTWTPRNAKTTSDLYGIAYGNGSFVAVGVGGTIQTSPDGIRWKSRRQTD